MINSIKQTTREQLGLLSRSYAHQAAWITTAKKIADIASGTFFILGSVLILIPKSSILKGGSLILLSLLVHLSKRIFQAAPRKIHKPPPEIHTLLTKYNFHFKRSDPIIDVSKYSWHELLKTFPTLSKGQIERAFNTYNMTICIEKDFNGVPEHFDEIQTRLDNSAFSAEQVSFITNCYKTQFRSLKI